MIELHYDVTAKKGSSNSALFAHRHKHSTKQKLIFANSALNLQLPPHQATRTCQSDSSLPTDPDRTIQSASTHRREWQWRIWRRGCPVWTRRANIPVTH